MHMYLYVDMCLYVCIDACEYLCTHVYIDMYTYVFDVSRYVYCVWVCGCM